ncbi:hypothetical protein I4U23_027361 [Adineta vaga]|nr:hypothetical protein I4U23_027361 [Adineta vaga]
MTQDSCHKYCHPIGQFHRLPVATVAIFFLEQSRRRPSPIGLGKHREKFGDLKDSNNFICLCPFCYQGYCAEFNIQPFGIILCSLFIDFTKQQKINRQFGVGDYLFTVPCVNQIALLNLLLRFVQMTLELSSVRTCKIMFYFLSIFTRITYRLTSWITIDRVLKKPCLSIGIIIITTIIILFIIFFLFSIQIITITLLIILITYDRMKTIEEKIQFGHILIKQMQISQRALYYTYNHIILSALPEAILTVKLACTELNEWQCHILRKSWLLFCSSYH